MDDLGGILTELFWKYFDIVWAAAKELAHKAWLTLWGALYDAAVWLESMAEFLARRVSLWQAVLCAVVLISGLILWMYRDTLYLRRFRHNIHWLRFRGYRPMVLDYRHGARQGQTDFLGREMPIPERFPGLRLFDAVPANYIVVFGPGNGGVAREVRTYPRETRAGREAVVRDMADHVRAAAHYVNPESEVEAFLAYLSGVDSGLGEVCVRRLGRRAR